MLGTIVNMLAIMLGAVIGVVLKRGLPAGAQMLVMEGLGLCTMVVGMKMALQADNDVIVVAAVALGSIMGHALHLDERLNALGEAVKFRIHIRDNTFVEAFVSSSMIVCVGAMAVVGSIEAGINGNYEILFVKSALDFIYAVVLASSLGLGVFFSGIMVLLYQGALTLLSAYLAPFMTDAVLMYLSASGGVLIIAIGLTASGIKEIKTINMLPGIFIAATVAYMLPMTGL